MGLYIANVFFADQELPGSPYKIKAEPSIDVKKVKVEGFEPSEFQRDFSHVVIKRWDA